MTRTTKSDSSLLPIILPHKLPCTRFYKYVPTIRINQARAPTCTPSPQATCKQQQAIIKRDERQMPSCKRIGERTGRTPYRIDARRDAVSRRIYEQYVPTFSDRREKRRAMHAVSDCNTTKETNDVCRLTSLDGTCDERRLARRDDDSKRDAR